MRLRIRVTGIVQGVGFRPFIYRIAVKNGLNGYVKNMGDAGVEILLEGNPESVNSFLKDLHEKKPPLAKICGIFTSELGGENQYEGFTIQESSASRELSGSVIPPDVAICPECLRELRDSENLRHDYFFITCTDCGPRFTIINKLPYDRENTTMQEFHMCSFCKSEYVDPLNRRFHAQTVACPKCGPKVYLTDRNGELVICKDPIREAGKLISEGHIVAIKGLGGFHVAASAIKDEPLIRLRKAKHRRQKPFALMARNLEAVKSFAEVTSSEIETLESPARPIVLLNKNEHYYLSDLVAPGLHNVGVMLPYTGLHYMLFDGVNDPAFVMTSANPPNQPIVKDDEDALRTLDEIVDYFLFHNRRIAHRCDDSVVRLHGGNLVFIRRSRGYAPAPITLKWKAKRCVLALGGELNNTACILNNEKAFLSQHIGDVENIETRNFLVEASHHLAHLTNSQIEATACDLHPKFTTTILAKEVAEKNDWRLFQVQHHYAHVAALMAEHGVTEIVGVCCDGYGYGADGEAWGGEVIFGSLDPVEFKRLAHLEPQPLLGGDLATRYPLRMAAGILHGKIDIEKVLEQNSIHFPHGAREVQLILHQLRSGHGIAKTTSCGRILDAASAILGLCYERTYEGEPAMKLESAAVKGKEVLNLTPILKGKELKTTEMMLEIYEKRKTHKTSDLAFSVHAYLAKGLAQLAIEKASENGVNAIGFSGGVACNQIMAEIMRKTVEDAGMLFLVHFRIPPGDGGLSFGQAVIAGFSRN
ncbi:MAG: carbamoyltransferase HypF [Candidatus Bathyarchaeota archaeon]|nr:carbamoyltransferase HypF [Candidatus Bathyarchaeota archaeon]MCX8176911.1 carbamoyltransferase HypF [Candidatus Bathyarchaeota archaeon]MDW8193402.1 carbamoyltransferase HypF [Nitrososphaerota archaeon]